MRMHAPAPRIASHQSEFNVFTARINSANKHHFLAVITDFTEFSQQIHELISPLAPGTPSRLHRVYSHVLGVKSPAHTKFPLRFITSGHQCREIGC